MILLSYNLYLVKRFDIVCKSGHGNKTGHIQAIDKKSC